MGHVRQNVVGERVKEARSRLRPPVTQRELSKRLSKLGVSIDRAGIAKIETGVRGVLDYEVVAISKALGVTSAWLLNSGE
ncbi:MAG TPA: helix-turn-helix transcriptional regulator [Candidatus Dormibacteraeota bacterium]|nr:helix-turn-helix transcriptional regulator [Candidatus Dormibacteraeota bacterium]